MRRFSKNNQKIRFFEHAGATAYQIGPKHFLSCSAGQIT
jgi:hypothetical protein